MANTLRSIPPLAQSLVFPSRRVGSQPPSGIAPVCLWLLSRCSRVGRGVARLSVAPSAARSLRWSLPTSLLPGLLLLALALTLVLAAVAFAAPLASVPVVLALLLVGSFGPSVVARQLGGIVASVIGLPGRYGLLATGSRTRSGRAYPPKRPAAR